MRSLSPVLARYLLHLESQGRSRPTIQTYRYVIGQWERAGFGPLEYLACLNHGSVSVLTRAYYGGILQGFFAWQVQAGLLALNPLAGLRFRKPPPKPVRPFSAGEVAAMLGTCQTAAERAIVLVLYQTGLRASELTGLRGQDIDWETKVITVVGKGNRGRLVAIAGATLEAIRALDGVGYLFPGMNGHRLYVTVRDIGRRAGVVHAHPHRFRHTFAHAFLVAGGNAVDLKILLGHSTWRMVELYTAYYETERALEAHRRFMSAVQTTAASRWSPAPPRQQRGRSRPAGRRPRSCSR